ncbi:MAG TPA: DUF4147 domain-containing protein [Terriglobia bacterium]|jgi:hydroxypyruvate reductase|nr:DUF4147 domain-containing protein [Terriglobia bacterium]
MGGKSSLASVAKPAYREGKHLAERVFLDAMAEIDVRRAMLARLKWDGSTLTAGNVSFPLAKPPRVVAFGKAATRMAQVLHEILDGRVESGVVVAPAAPVRMVPHFRYYVGGHPYPSSGSIEGAGAALELVSNLKEEDNVIFLVSGGGSAVFERPFDPSISLEDLVEFNRVLVTGGLPIEKINVLRKHLSAVKGGRLAIQAYPARQLTIYISDVPEHLPSIVASGPTMPDESTIQESYDLAEQHGLVARFPASIRHHFEKRTLTETPKPDDERFLNSRYYCLLSNRHVVAAAREAAEKLGFVSEIGPQPWDIDFRRLAEANLGALDSLAKAHEGQPVCLVVGGEVTCPVTGPGVGGRNQAFVLYAAQLIAGLKRVVLSAGTDGRDGNSPASGAVADGQTMARAQALGMDAHHHLMESDAYSFFRSLGDTLDTGFTDNNVRDLRLWLDFGV